ncbi:uncharacterized protein LOC119836281 [Zerene cesonia]|uniref:uncharacterized protein LOC119836281 n=1 Tax=Zerene cesonia TaxID=33412 RepID=UPI0018E523DE|nr:uncharacterized protein LOC119836281 [Zerene cesonia]
MYVWTFLLLALSVIETIKSELPEADFVMDEFPLYKSLGISIGRRPGRTLDDGHLEKEFKELYQDMMKGSEEVDKTEDLDAYVSHTDLTRLKSASDRRRSVMRSPAIKRRARSQTIRRQKLNSQSLRSHFQHSRQSNYEE